MTTTTTIRSVCITITITDLHTVLVSNQGDSRPFAVFNLRLELSAATDVTTPASYYKRLLYLIGRYTHAIEDFLPHPRNAGLRTESYHAALAAARHLFEHGSTCNIVHTDHTLGKLGYTIAAQARPTV